MKQAVSQLNWRYTEWPDRRPMLIAESATGRWNGNDWGDEWTEGFALDLTTDTGTYDLWTDDGHGNGDHLGEFKTHGEAITFAEEIDQGIRSPYDSQYRKE